MDAFTQTVADKLFAKNQEARPRTKKREEMLQKRRFKAMPIEKKVEVIKARYGLTHGGGKQNKKRKAGKKNAKRR